MNFGAIGKAIMGAGQDIAQSRAGQGFIKAGQGLGEVGGAVADAGRAGADSVMAQLSDAVFNKKMAEMVGERVPEGVNKADYFKQVFNSLSPNEKRNITNAVKTDVNKYLGYGRDAGMVGAGGAAGAYLAE